MPISIQAGKRGKPQPAQEGEPGQCSLSLSSFEIRLVSSHALVDRIQDEVSQEGL